MALRLLVRSSFLVTLLALPSCGSQAPGPSPTPAPSGPGWPQWGQNPQHTGHADVSAQSPERLLADVVYDPFAAQEQVATGGALTVHYPVPLVNGDDVFLTVKSGAFTGIDSWETQAWSLKRLSWQGTELRERWTFRSDWKPEPNAGALGGWEPVHQAVLDGETLYVPGSGGTAFKVSRADGSMLARLNPFGGGIDPSVFVAGPLALDASGNLYYNVLQLDPAGPWTRDARGAWLVRIGRDGTTRAVPFSSLTAGTPAASDACLGTFSPAQLPWPPSPEAVPPSVACGSQRPGLNVAPAIGPDGTIYTVSRAHFSSRWGYLVAVNPDLSPRWIASLRERFTDGCGVPGSAGGTLPANGAPGGCRAGASLGVDPATNRPGGGEVLDQSSSSPVVAPDGAILYGAYSRYNYARGHLMKFSAGGQFLAAHDFGWDTTPAVYTRGGAYSVVIKDNHYEGVGSYCGNDAFCPSDEIDGPYSIVQLRGDTLAEEWAFRNTNTQSCRRNPDGSLACVSDHPNSFEWCINAPAIDRDGVVYANSEDGGLYAIAQGGALRKSLFLQLALEAAYTPLALGPDGRIYTQNFGHLLVVGR